MISVLISYILCVVCCLIGDQYYNRISYETSIDKSTLNTKDSDRRYNVFFVLITLILSTVSGLRMGFVDTASYRKIYEMVGTHFDKVISNDYRVEHGFRFICYLLNFLSKDSQLLLITTSVFINVGICYFIYKYSEDKWLSSIIYFTTVYLTTMNTMRQYIVICVFLLMIPLIKERKWVYFFLVSALLTTIHSTAIWIALILYFCYGRFFNKKIKVFCLVMLFLSIIPTGSFINLIQKYGTNDYADMYVSLNKSGVSILRVLVQAVPVILTVFINKNNPIDVEKKPEDVFFMNMSILNFATYILAIRNNYIVRFSLYFEIYNVVILPFLVNRSFKQKKSAKLLAAFLYSVYFYFVLRGFGRTSVDNINPFFI